MNQQPDFYKELLDNVSEYIYSVCHVQGVPVSLYHSPACKKITGYSVEDFENNPNLWHEMIHPDDREPVTEFIKNILSKGGKDTIQHRIYHRDGSLRCVSNTTTVIHHEADQKIMMNGFVQDITDKKLSEERLLKLIRAVEQSPSTVVITNHKGEIEYANPKFTAVTGYTSDEVSGKNPRILKSGEQNKEFYKTMWETILGGNEWRGEFHNRKKSGELYWELASISPIRDRDGRVTHFVAVKEDITDRKRVEDALKISEAGLRSRNELMEKDLKLAQVIQKAILPKAPPVNSFMNIDYRFLPLDKIGGDYFSFMNTDESSMSVFLGDVSGHGISSALFLTLIKSVTDRIYRKYGDDPSEYMSRLNLSLIDEMNSYFITAVYLLFKFSKSGVSLSLANGGHPKPVLYRAATGEYTRLVTSGTVIGTFEKAIYAKTEIDLFPGDRIYLCTDGIPESENSINEMIGFDEGTVELFRRSYRKKISETMDAVLDEVKKFTGGKPHEDDIVLMGFEIK